MDWKCRYASGMARPLRIEFPGALYHVTARGDRREDIFEDDALFLDTLGDVTRRFNWLCHAYCLMSNHYHLMIGTPDGNLSKGMRHLNGVFTQATNRRHQRAGHLFQGRYKAIVVDGNAYLLELARYIMLNPVRANMVPMPGDYVWSSYRATVGAAVAPLWLSIDPLLAAFGPSRGAAVVRFQSFVAAGVNAGSLDERVSRSIFLGDKGFVKNVQALAEDKEHDFDIPRIQRRAPPLPLSQFAQSHSDRDAAMIAAHATGEYSYVQIARFFGVHFTTVGRVVRRALRTCD